MACWFITGCSTGIGREIAGAALEAGHSVAVTARNTGSVADFAERFGDRALVLPLDVTDRNQITAAVAATETAFGGIDVLVNNAGYAVYGAVEDVPIADARHQFEVNLFGLARMIQLVLPGMRERRSGTIINISSMGGTIYTPLGAWYHATKHAVEGFSDCLRIELARFGIDVVIVAPGAIDTGFNEILGEQVAKASAKGPYAAMAKGIADAARPGRGSKPDVIAGVIARAVAARRPKTRYRAGQFSHLLVYLRRMLPDRLFDQVVLRAMG